MTSSLLNLIKQISIEFTDKLQIDLKSRI